MKARLSNLLLVLALVASFGETFHYALVDHHFCALHGEVEHGAVEGETDSHKIVGLSLSHAAPEGLHAHSDCVVSRSAKVSTSLSPVSVAVRAEAPTCFPQLKSFSSFDLLHLAPKLPPPV